MAENTSIGWKIAAGVAAFLLPLGVVAVACRKPPQVLPANKNPAPRRSAKAAAMSEEDAQDYYTSEACHYFAIALHRMFGYEIGMLVDTGEKGFSYRRERIPGVAHVFCHMPYLEHPDPKTADVIDVMGVRKANELTKHWFDLLEPEIYWSVPEDELIEVYTGSSDSRPLYKVTKKHIEEATAFILAHRDKYVLR